MWMSRTDPLVGQFGIIHCSLLATGTDKRNVNRCLYEIADAQNPVLIWDNNTNTDGASLRIDVRVDERHAPVQRLPWQGLHLRCDFLPVAYCRRIVWELQKLGCWTTKSSVGRLIKRQPPYQEADREPQTFGRSSQ